METRHPQEIQNEIYKLKRIMRVAAENLSDAMNALDKDKLEIAELLLDTAKQNLINLR